MNKKIIDLYWFLLEADDVCRGVTQANNDVIVLLNNRLGSYVIRLK